MSEAVCEEPRTESCCKSIIHIFAVCPDELPWRVLPPPASSHNYRTNISGCLFIPPFFFPSSFLFLLWMQLFSLAVGGPTTVIKHQLAHLQKCINEARRPAAGAAGYNLPVAPQQDNGRTVNHFLPTRLGATSDEQRGFQPAVDLLTSSQTVEARRLLTNKLFDHLSVVWLLSFCPLAACN